MAEVEGDIRLMQEVVGKVFFDTVSLITETDNEIIEAVAGIDFHNMPQNGLFADFDHGFRFEMGFFTDSRPKTAS